MERWVGRAYLDDGERLLQHGLDGLQLGVVELGQAGHGPLLGQRHLERLRLHVMAQQPVGTQESQK
jgi:hypothetical protein